MPVLRVTRVPKESRELAYYYLELASRIENHISTTRLPSLLMSLSLSVFAAGATLRVYEDEWFNGAEFAVFAGFAIALLAAGVAVHIAELDLPRKDKQANITEHNGQATRAQGHQDGAIGSAETTGEPATGTTAGTPAAMPPATVSVPIADQPARP
jgi:hypothetical protein